MDMGIVHAGQLAVYEDIPRDLLEHVEDVVQPIDEGIIVAGRNMRAGAVAKHVDSDQIGLGQIRRHRKETGGVVEPTVQRQHLRTLWVAHSQGRDAAARSVQCEFLRTAHPWLSSTCANAATWPGSSFRAPM